MYDASAQLRKLTVQRKCLMRVALSNEVYQKKTRNALLLSNILGEPLFTVYGFIAFILCKDLGATAFQIAILTMLKPLVSIFSFYWSSGLSKNKGRLRSNLIWAGILGRLPFLFFPLIQDPWFVIAASAIYMLFYRAGTPAWIEILKLNLPTKVREKTFSFGYVLSYVENMILSLGIGALLDQNPNIWQILFFGSALFGMASLYIFARMPINHQEQPNEEAVPKDSLKDFFLKPWKNSWDLMQNRRDFSLFQWGFMLCGFGIMLIQPAVPLFLVKWLHLSYMDFGIALSLCKGLGIALSSSFWARLMPKIPIFKMSSLVFILVGCFPVFLLLAPLHIGWLYLAYAFYGIAQGGSHLLWNLSGASFAGKEDSSLFSGVNVVMVGLRGAVAPPLGGFLCVLLGPLMVLFLGVFFCFYSGYFLLRKRSLAAQTADTSS